MTLTAVESSRPQASEFAPYYGKYIEQVRGDDINRLLQSQATEMATFLRGVPESQAGVLHAPYTWTLKQVVNHLNDGERIFAYRMLRIARGDTTPLPGFDESEYARTSHVERLALADLAAEFDAVRAATLALLRSLPDEAWRRTGTANNYSISVRALAWIMAGHVQHHLAIMRKRLGK